MLNKLKIYKNYYIYYQMDLKSLCSDELIKLIKNLPPTVRDEIIEITTNQLKEEAKKKIINDIKSYASNIVTDVTDLILISHRVGDNWKRPSYTYRIDDELFDVFVDIAETFVNKNLTELVFHKNYSLSNSDSDSE